MVSFQLFVSADFFAIFRILFFVFKNLCRLVEICTCETTQDFVIV